MFLIGQMIPILKSFFRCLEQLFEAPQWPHFWRMVLVFAVMHGRRTIKNAHSYLRRYGWRQRLSHFLAKSPWNSELAVQRAARTILDLMAPQSGELLEIIFDASKNKKRGNSMECASWFYDHTTGHWVFGHLFLACTLRFRGIVIPWTIHLYVPKDAFLKPRQNRTMSIQFRSMHQMTAEIIRAFPQDLASRFRVRVLFDSAFLNKIVARACRERGWPWISVAKSNRAFRPQRGQPRRKKGKRNHISYHVGSYGPGILAHQGKTIQIRRGRRAPKFRVASRVGFMNGLGRVRAVFSRRLSDGSYLTLATNDLSLTPKEVVIGYQARWTIEVLFKKLKQHLGLGDYQTTRYEGVVHHLHLCLVAYLLLTHLGLRRLGKAAKRPNAMLAIEPVQELQEHLRVMVGRSVLGRIATSSEGHRIARRIIRWLRKAA